MKFAVFFVFVAFIAVQLNLAAGEEFVCQKGVAYIENDCNACSCNGPGNGLSCTYKGCFGPKQTELHNCEVGTSFEKGCNKCWCAKDVGTICTNKQC